MLSSVLELLYWYGDVRHWQVRFPVCLAVLCLSTTLSIMARVGINHARSDQIL